MRVVGQGEEVSIHHSTTPRARPESSKYTYMEGLFSSLFQPAYSKLATFIAYMGSKGKFRDIDFAKMGTVWPPSKNHSSKKERDREASFFPPCFQTTLSHTFLDPPSLSFKETWSVAAEIIPLMKSGELRG